MIFFCVVVTIGMGYGLVTGFMVNLWLIITINYRAIVDSHILYFTKTRNESSALSSPVLCYRFPTVEAPVPLGYPLVPIPQPQQVLTQPELRSTCQPSVLPHQQTWSSSQQVKSSYHWSISYSFEKGSVCALPRRSDFVSTYPFFCNPILFAICRSAFSRLLKYKEWHVEECSVALFCNC
jgi:hypothetical protein